jgi:hypothetical protein
MQVDDLCINDRHNGKGTKGNDSLYNPKIHLQLSSVCIYIAPILVFNQHIHRVTVGTQANLSQIGSIMADPITDAAQQTSLAERWVRNEDDWSGITDTRERRKIQNRRNQRNRSTIQYSISNSDQIG